MGTFAAYSFESGIYLLAGYLIYKWLLSAQNQPAFNRAVLLAIYALALIAPLVHFPDFAQLAEGSQTGIIVKGGPVREWTLAKSPAAWASVCVMVYYIGVIVATAFTITSFVRLFAILRKGERRSADGYTLILLSDTKFATFSWLRYIVMSRTDFEDAAETILLHERAHLRLRHWMDLLLAQAVAIVIWYNPAAWLMRAELRSVHEYQADDAVLQSGADARQYQLLLTKKAVGQRFPSLANSLNHSKLKNRITMMCNQKSSPARRLRALAIAPAIALAAVVVNTPAVVSALGTASAATLIGSKISENNLTAQIPAPQNQTTAAAEADQPEVPAEYPGGQMAMFKFLGDNVKYPTAAEKQGSEGRVVVSFVVGPDGKISDISVSKSVSSELDAEAIRVVGLMPAWTPAKSAGKPVACHMSLPITFKLAKSTKKAN